MKKRLRQLSAIILAVSLTATSISWDGLYVQAAVGENAQSAEAEENRGEGEPEASELQPGVESVEEKTEYSTIYDLGGHKKMEVIFGSDVRYLDENGELADYDASLVEIEESESLSGKSLEGYSYTNAQGDMKNYLPETVGDETPVLLEREGYSISFHPVSDLEKEQTEQSKESESQEETVETSLILNEAESGSEAENVEAETEALSFSEAIVEEQEVTDLHGEEQMLPMAVAYEGDPVSFRYESSDIGVKEEIVLDAVPEKNYFVHEFRTEGLTVRKNTLDEGFSFYDKETGELVGGIPAPNMNDASGKAYSDDITCEIVEKEGDKDTFLLTTTVDWEYLQDEERVYPVKIDPSVNWTGTSKIADPYVCNGSAYQNYNFYTSGITLLSVGHSNSQGLYRNYLKFTGLASSINGKYVESAKLTLYETGGGTAGKVVQARRITSDWQPSAITWNKKPGNDSSAYSSITTSNKQGAADTLDLTAFARQVASGAVKDYGIMLGMKNESNTGTYSQFYNSRAATASYRPKLAIVYYDGPATPTSVKASPIYLRPGTAVNVSWAGITSRSLNRIEYRVVNYKDATGETLDNAIGYDASRSLGKTASGTVTVPGSNNWVNGCFKLYVRGVDNGGIVGTGRGDVIHIDGIAPILTAASITPSGYTANQTPTLMWTASDTHFSKVQYQVGNNAYVDAGTAAIGSAVLPAAYFPNGGTYTIRVRAVDKAGNISAVRTLNYYLDRTAPAIGSLTMNPAAGTWTTNGNPLIQFTNITELQAGLDTARTEYSMVPEGQGQGNYKKGTSLSYTSAANPWAGSFRLDSTDQARGDGAYTIFVRFWDKASIPSVGYLSYKKDINAPTGTISCSLPNDNLHDTAQITTNLSDGSGSGIKNSSLVLKNASATIVSTIYSNFTTASVTRPFDTRTLQNGAYKLVLTVSDHVNHVSTIETPVAIKNQLKAPKVTGSITNNGRGAITWSQEVEKTPLKEIQCKLPGKSTWTKVSSLQSGTYQFSISGTNQEHTVLVRGVDTDGVVGKEAAAICVYDTIKPGVALTSMVQGVLKGSVSDQYLDRWTIESKEKGHSVSEYQQIAEGSDAVQNDILTIVRLESLNYQVGHTYEFRLAAWDKAGNNSNTVYEHTKRIEDTGAVYAQPEYEIAWPQYAKEADRQYRIPLNTNYFEVKGENTGSINKTSWYINNQKISEVNNNSTHKNVLDFHKVKSNYEEGADYTITAECTDTSGKVTYSVPVLEKAFKHSLIEAPYSGFNTEIRDQKIVISNPKDPGIFEKRLTFQDPLVSFSLQAEDNNISYSVKTGDSQWVPISVRGQYRISQLFPDRLTVSDLTIQANMVRNGMMTPELTVCRLEGDTLQGEHFQLSEMDNYTPEFVSAVSKINYKTYLNWSRLKEKDTSDFSKEKQVSIPENVSYEIYRAGDEDSLKKMTVPSLEGIHSDYFSEMNINYGEAFYYRIRAVGTKKNAVTGKTEKAYSSFSPIFFTKVVDGDEYVKLLGDKSYWTYEAFSTPNGNGGVEKSRGNFTYSQTDAEIPNENLAVMLDRTYNNQASTVSSLGHGWNHNYDVELLNINESDQLIDRKAVKDETGTIFLFEKVSSGTYASSMGKYITLKAENRSEHITIPAKNGNSKIDTNIVSSYTMRTKDNLEYRFNSGGQLIYLTEPNNSFVLLEYDGQTGRLAAVVTNQNLITRFQYADNAKEKADDYVQQGQNQSEEVDRESRGEGAENEEIVSRPVINMDHLGGTTITRPNFPIDTTVSQAVTNLALVQSVTLPDGGQIDYEYDSLNRLKSVTRKADAEGSQQVVYRYEYDQEDNLTVIQDAKGNPYRLTYDGKKVSEFFYPEVNGKQESTKFVYRNIQEGDAVYETVIQKGLNGTYGLSELVKSSRDGNTLYSRDEKGVECTYTYEDNLLKTAAVKSEYQEIVNDTVVTKEGVRNSQTTYNKALHMNPVLDVDADQNSTSYEYANQSSEILDDLPTRVAEDSEGKSISDCSYTYDAYGNETKGLDQVTGDSVESTYYGPESEFSGEIRQEVEKTRVLSESGEVSYAVTTRTYQYTYNPASGIREERVTEVTGEKSVTSISRYDRMGNLVYEDDGLGTVSSFTYDYLGRMTGGDYSEGGIISSSSNVYDENGTLVRETGKDGTVSEYTYDAKNRLIKKVISKGDMSRTYLTEYGYEWKNAINETQELVSIVKNTTPGGQICKDYFNQVGWHIESISHGISVKTEYDKHGEAILTKTTNQNETGEEIVTITLYDNAGNAWASIENPIISEGSWKIGDDSILNKSTYDSQGNELTSTDGEGLTQEFEYDQLSRISKIFLKSLDSRLQVAEYNYDIYEESGKISSKITDANGNISKEYRDFEGDLVQISDLGNGQINPITSQYTYDKRGNVIKEVYSNGCSKTSEYDGRNRLIKAIYSNQNNEKSLITKYKYSYSDEILSMEDFEVHNDIEIRYRYTGYEYDDLGQVIGFSEINCNDGREPDHKEIMEYQIKYIYNKDGNVIEIVYPQVENHVYSLQYEYNENALISKIYIVYDTESKYILREYFYNSLGKVYKIKDFRNTSCGVQEDYIAKSYTYDKLMRVLKMEYRDSGNINLCKESYEYSYDKNSNILSEKVFNDYPVKNGEKLNELHNYKYDAWGRLISNEILDKRNNSQKETFYTYDNVGNRLTESEEEDNSYYTYNSLNQLVNVKRFKKNVKSSDKDYGYDKNGNLIIESDIIENKETQYLYNDGNQLKHAIITENDKVILDQTNIYNGMGQRVLKRENDDVTNYYYQGGSVLYTTDELKNKTSFNIIGTVNNIIASLRYDGNYNNQFYFYNKDIKGSTSNIIDQKGNAVTSYTYTAFGDTTQRGDLNFKNEICYTGGIYDSRTKLYYLNSRYYDSEIGRFTGEDTYRGEDNDYTTWNLYAYCNNNPINQIDPSGHAAIAIPKIGFDIGAAVVTAGKFIIGGVAAWIAGSSISKILKSGQSSKSNKYSALSNIKINIPKIDLSSIKVSAASFKIPNISIPKIKLPNIKIPKIHLGNLKIDIPDISIPAVEIPKIPDVKRVSKKDKEKNKKRRPSKKTDKEASKDSITWIPGLKKKFPKKNGEDGKTYIARLFDQRYGKGNYPKGAGSEFSQAVKNFVRHR